MSNVNADPRPGAPRSILFIAGSALGRAASDLAALLDDAPATRRSPFDGERPTQPSHWILHAR